MAALMILIVSMVTLASSAIIQTQPSTHGPVYVPANRLPTYSTSAGSAQLGGATILAIPLSVVATSDDDLKSPVEIVKEVVANVAEKVADVVADVRDKVADVVDNVKDKIADVVDDAKAGASSRGHADVFSKTKDDSNETKDDSDETDKFDDNSDELKSDGGNSTEKTSKSTENDSKDNDKKSNDDDDSKNKLNSEKSSTEVRTDILHGGDKQKDDSKEDNIDKDGNKRKVNETDDSSEHQSEGKKDIADSDDKHNNDEDSSEKVDSKSMWSWLKTLTGHIDHDSGDDDTKVRHYLTQISKVRGYLDAMDSSIALSMAKQSGTCPVYPIQVGNNRVTITTENGCKIIIRLKGLTVDKIEDGHQQKKGAHKRSVLVSYSDS